MRIHTDKEKRMWRAWAYAGENYNCIARTQISWGVNLCIFSMGFDSEDGHIGLTWAVPGLFTHFACAWPRKWTPKSKYYGDIELFKISIHGGAIWWAFGRDNMSGSNEIPRWRDGNFNVVDFLLGRRSYSAEVIEEAPIKITMPEAEYFGTGKLLRAQWKRPRWPWLLVITRAEIEVEAGVPFPGKGESSWDCGEDASYSMTAPASSIAEGVKKFTEHVLDRRRTYGGPNWRPEASQ